MRRKTFIPHEHKYVTWKVLAGTTYMKCENCQPGTPGHVMATPKTRSRSEDPYNRNDLIRVKGPDDDRWRLAIVWTSYRVGSTILTTFNFIDEDSGRILPGCRTYADMFVIPADVLRDYFDAIAQEASR